MPAPNQQLLPSVLDRLIDRQPKRKTEEPDAHLISLKELKKLLERDLNILAQTHRASLAAVPANLTELRKSSFAFGVPEFTSFSVTNHDASQLAEELEATIERFEPRLQLVRVTVDKLDANLGTISFFIDAYLNIEPAPEKVRFDATLPLHGQSLSVREHRTESDG